MPKTAYGEKSIYLMQALVKVKHESCNLRNTPGSAEPNVDVNRVLADTYYSLTIL